MVKQLMNRYMIRGTNGPMQRILDMRGRCMQYNKQRTTEGRIDWVGDRVLYKDVGFHLEQLRGMVREGKRQARQVLMEELSLSLCVCVSTSLCVCVCVCVCVRFSVFLCL
jgi:hypothetical protein